MTERATDGKARREPWASEGAEADALFELARSLDAPSSEDAPARRFVAAFRAQSDTKAERSRLTMPRQWHYGLAFVAAVSLVLLWFKAGSLPWSGDALSYRVSSGAVASQLLEARHEPIKLDFSDGTVVTVERATRAHVSETTQRGARFRLDSGKLSFDVVPHAERGNWSVDAGPFQVRVTGTIFTVEWLAAEGSLRVDVTRGHVIVEGAGQRRELGAGDSFQHREASAATGGVLLEVPAATARAVAAEPPNAVRPALPAAEKERSWSDLVAAGQFAAVIDAAHRRGAQACLSACSREDLRALADAARLGNDGQLAERALLAQRARFAGSSDATAAAFLLGRRAEDRREPNAIAWYDNYLSEAPQGRFAGDALGRKMLLVAKSDAKRGAALAEQYLERFRAGPYAGHARSLLEAKGRGH